MLKERYFYPAFFTYENDGQITIFFPDLDAVTCAETEDDALIAARELLGITMLGIEEDGDDIPKSSTIKDMHVDKNEAAILVDVFMPAIRLASKNRSVNRTVTLPAWLNAKGMELGFNFSQLLQEALKERIGCR